jgi:hypothetical protein
VTHGQGSGYKLIEDHGKPFEARNFIDRGRKISGFLYAPKREPATSRVGSVGQVPSSRRATGASDALASPARGSSVKPAGSRSPSRRCHGYRLGRRVVRRDRRMRQRTMSRT